MTISDSETNTTHDLRPRKYQEEIFERAQKENVIAALNTGSGKTLIGLLLIKWISALESARDKLIIFLVPRVTLVDQQANYISENTPLRVSKLSGALDIELSDRMRWRRRLEHCDVLVMTPQILVNMITHSLWGLQRVALLVFDECHHTRKNHPYNIIMREYFQIKAQKERPKVFGMTASPIWNMKDPVGSLLTLEKNMDSIIIGVREHTQELAVHTPRPSELINIYSMPPKEYDFHEPTLFHCLSTISPSTWDYIKIPWSNLVVRYDTTLYNLGPYCASLYLFLEVWHAVKRVQPELSVTNGLEMEDAGVTSTKNSRKVFPKEVAIIRDILAGYEGFFWVASSPNIVPTGVPTGWCSPKVIALRDILLEFYTANFQAIVFVEQRQTAACLSKVLPAIPELKGKIRSAHLVGQGANIDGVSKTTDAYHGDAVNAFRAGKVNVLLATSVAEEGLNFPACDLVVRFDPLRHMVAYVQSRGRARNAASRFVVMIRENDLEALTLYQTLQAHEPEMNRAYQSRHGEADTTPDLQEADEDEDDELDPSDLAGRERYIVPKTNAPLTYDNAIELLNRLCSLIPCDAYTPSHKPKFIEGFQSTVKLPLSIPLPPEQLIYTGPLKHSKKEAKRAVAFMAAKHLHELNVFDDYLLPTPGKGLTKEESAHALLDLQPQVTPVMIDVEVKYPWTLGDRLWLHPVYVKGEPSMGLIAGVLLPLVELHSDALLRLGRPQILQLDVEDEMEKRRAMHEYTRLGIFYRVTGSPLANALGAFLVPLTDDLEVDFDQILRVVENPKGIFNWEGVEGGRDTFLVLNKPEHGRTRVLRQTRDDLSPMSTPPDGSVEAVYPTYHEYWSVKWARGNKRFEVPTDGPLLEAPRLVKHAISNYSLDPSHRIPPVQPDLQVSPIVPLHSCGWVNMSPEIIRVFELFPMLCHKLTDAYRAQAIRSYIGLPLIPDDLLIEALTLPSVDADFSNQRLETLGDAVLDICTTVHMMIKYPRRHEGQLSNLRQRVISNKFLVSCARVVGLEIFISSERTSVSKWPFVEQDGYEDKAFRERKSVKRQIPRRGLQDCVEALLGASFIAGGIPVALQTGVALGLSFGGLQPWGERVKRNERKSLGVPALVVKLQKELGYTFENAELLVEAVTHPSFESSTTPSYQRLEFLGDSVIKMVVTIYLFNKFPNATSHQLALPRTKSICSPALASLGIRKLQVHKYILHNSVDLNHAINLYIPILESTSAEEIVRRGWRYDPPKAISDVFESIVGAIFVDTGYNLDRTSGIVTWLMEDVLEALSPSTPKDPVSELLEWLGSVGCSGHMKFDKTTGQKDGVAVEGVSAVFHGTVVSGPIVSASKNVAKFAAAEKALVALRNVNKGELLKKLCDCKHRMVVDEAKKDIESDQRSEDGEDAEEEKEEAEVAQMLTGEEFS
ncbi:Dicer-like protein 1 [Leucoagaricus sp. SymC.cos]|nr:Dicer-like protein 1 [Leucoagaricus sp. SymC.cos]